MESGKLTLQPIVTSRCGTPSRIPFRKSEIKTRDHSTALAIKCKNSAMDIKKRDEIRENRSITRELLIQKFTNRYGPRMKRRIILQVDALMSTKRDGNVTEEEENQLNEAILSSIGDGTLLTGRSDLSESALKAQSTIPPPLTLEKVPPRNLPGNSTESPTIRGESCVTPIPVGAEWEAVRIYQAYLTDTKTRAQQQQQLQKKKELAERLAEQVRENDNRREREKKAAREEAEKARRDYEKYRQDTGVNYQKREQDIKELRDSWEQQIADWKAKLENEKQADRYQYQRDLEELYDSIRQEELYLAEKKEKEKLINQESMEINTSNINYKLNQLKQEREKEIQLNIEFVQMEEEREQAKKKEIEDRMMKLEKYYKWAHTAFPRPVTPSSYILKRVEEERNQIANEEIQRELTEKEHREKLDRLTRQENMMLINQKKQFNEEKQQKEKEYGQKLRNETKEYEENLKESRQRELKMRRDMGRELLRQDHNGYEEVDRNTMTPMERTLNKEAIETVASDPALNSLLQSRITHRMRMSLTSASGSTGPGYVSARSVKRPSTSQIFG